MSSPANENRTTLYRIRRKSDGKFLCVAPSDLPEGKYGISFERQWGPSGCFWKTEATITKHLYELCRFRVYNGGEPKEVYWNDMGLWPWGTPVKTVKVQYEKLDLYEVVATMVTEHSSDTMEARAFASFQNDERRFA